MCMCMNIKTTTIGLLLASGLFLSAMTAHSEDRVRLEGTSIIGNRELPKVLYIAPWKKPYMSELGRPVNSLINEIISPIERDVMKRTIRYHGQLNKNNNKQAKTSQ